MSTNFSRIILRPIHFPAAVLIGAIFLAAVVPPAPADEVPVPTVTAAATPYSTAYSPTNLFAPGKGEYATKGQGPCSIPLTTTTTNGTWVEMDFGSNVTFDRFILATRQDTSDYVGTNVLYVGTNSVHTTSDPHIFTFPTAGNDSSGPIRYLGGPITGRYVRWEVLSYGAASGTSANLGGRHMWFLLTPSNSVVLAEPTVITNTAAPVFTTPEYSTAFPPGDLVDGNGGNGVSASVNYEYAENQSVNGLPVIVFDFGATNIISGFDFLNRENDLITAFNLVFSDDPTFTDILATSSWTANTNDGNFWNSGEFAPISARYVQLQATATALTTGGTPNPGGREIIFYGPTNQPPSLVQQPIAATNVTGNTFTLSVVVQTNGLADTLQWQLNGTNLTDGPSVSGTGAVVSGSTTSSLLVSGVTPFDSGNYAVVLSNALGVVTSRVSVVNVFSAPTIAAGPNPSNVVLYAGQSAAISLTAFGSAPITYTWYSNGAQVAVTSSEIYQFPNIQTDFTGYGIVSNSFGAATSAVLSVTVVPSPEFPYPLAVLHDHPSHFWPLNEIPDDGAGNDGTLAFDYVGGDDGIYTNAVLGAQGYGPGLAAEYGYTPALDTNSAAQFGIFSSTDSDVEQIPNVDFGIPAGSNAEFSVETWAFFFGNSGGGIIAKGYGGGGEEFTLDTGSSSAFRFFVRNAAGTSYGASSTIVPQNNLWYHLVGVCDEAHSNVLLYVNGAQAAVAAIPALSGVVSDSSVSMSIGSRSLNSTSGNTLQSFCSLNDVAVYDYPLTSAQIGAHYSAAGVGPAIVLQPPSVTNVDEGTTLIIPASATGSVPLAYQWYDVSSGSPGTPIAGQTNASLVINNVSAALYNNHSLAMTVTNLYGQATCSEVLVEIQAGPPSSVIISPSAVTVYAGDLVPFSVTAQGTVPFFYQWSVNGVNVPDATNAAYTNLALSGGPYAIACAVSNSIVSGSPPSATATLTVVAKPSDSYAAAVLQDDPIAYWRLDEATNATTAYDYIGGHNASYYNAVNGLPGFRPSTIPSETATGFGMNGIVNASLALENDNTASGIPFIDFSTQGSNAEFSVEAWVQAPALEPTTGAGIVAKGYGGGGEQFGLDTGTTSPSSFRFFVRTGAGAAVDDASGFNLDGNWHHVVGVCDEAGGSLYIYVDGELQSTAGIAPGTGVLSIDSSSFPVAIGSRALSSADTGYYDQMTNAVIDDVAIYDYPLTADQVAAHFNAAPLPGPINLSIQFSNKVPVISWTTPLTGYVLQENSSLGTTNWVTVTNAAFVTNGLNQVQVTVAATNTAQFYRLQSQ